MRWLDLSSYGVALKIGTGVADGVLFVESADGLVAEALGKAQFQQTGSGVWYRRFEVDTCLDVLDLIAAALPDSNFCEVEDDAVFINLGRHLAPPPAAPVPAIETFEIAPAVVQLTPQDTRSEPMDVTEQARGRSGLAARLLDKFSRAVSFRRRPASKAADSLLEFEWVATTTAEDARRLSGLSDLPGGSYFVGALRDPSDRPLAEGKIGGNAMCAAGSISVMSVVSPKGGSVFGAEQDVLVIGVAEFARGPEVAESVSRPRRLAAA